ncbi:hypothetical protein [Reichenbachiella sp. MALMAid0571]|uniref:hypothetical protein n=1 Tax=Reichenbachiella sp. MALMAid0571 TaxID=3143939 RepID=UPI0032DE304A
MIFRPNNIEQEILDELNEADLTKHLKNYCLFLDSLINLNETLTESKLKIPLWQIYSETLTIKFILHSNSLYQLFLAHPLRSQQMKKDLRFLDISSILVLSRTLLENFLTHWHIYINPISIEEQEFRFNVWVYSSLIDRKKNRGIRRILTEELRLREEKEIQEYEYKLINSKFLKELTPKQQNQLLKKGNTRLFKDWRTIIDECEFADAKTWKEHYGYLSGFTHSEGISAAKIRFNYNNNPDEVNNEAILCCYMIKMLMAKFIMELVSKYKIIEIKFNTFPLEIREAIKIYSIIASNKKV